MFCRFVDYASLGSLEIAKHVYPRSLRFRDEAIESDFTCSHVSKSQCTQQYHLFFLTLLLTSCFPTRVYNHITFPISGCFLIFFIALIFRCGSASSVVPDYFIGRYRVFHCARLFVGWYGLFCDVHDSNPFRCHRTVIVVVFGDCMAHPILSVGHAGMKHVSLSLSLSLSLCMSLFIVGVDR